MELLKILKEYKEKFNNMEKNYKEIIKFLNKMGVEYDSDIIIEDEVIDDVFYIIEIEDLGVVIKDYGDKNIYVYYDFNDEEEVFNNIKDLKNVLKNLIENLK